LKELKKYLSLIFIFSITVSSALQLFFHSDLRMKVAFAGKNITSGNSLEIPGKAVPTF